MEHNVKPPQDPDVVFSADYWAPSHESFAATSYGWVPRRKRKEGEALVADIAMKVIHGVVQGSPLSDGVVFDPSDDELARTSAANFPGAILLGDREVLRPIDWDSKYERKHIEELDEKDEKEREIEATHLDKTPRSLLRASLRVNEDLGVTHFGGATIEYHNGYSVYSRFVNILYIAQDKKGRGHVEQLMWGHSVLGQKGEVEDDAILFTAYGWRPAAVGEPQVAYDEQGVDFKEAYRLRYLEVVASGQPAEARQHSRLPKLLGSFASGR
jgi:hypothetical protein